jgi:hypothetical protein
MHVTAIHHIHDPTGFQKAEAEENEMPPGFELLIRAATNDHTTGVCIWEGPSVEEVKKFVDSIVGPYSHNEYFEMTVNGL